jgi:glyoxylase-like metal-dependent hydrolase (beta-lactamase superfamily II)
MQLRCLLLVERDAQKKLKRAILIDNGIGEKWTEKFAQIYKVDHTTWNIDQELAKKGLKTSDITDVIATHFHFDHMGGTTRRNDKGEFVPTFENAKIWAQRQNWDLAHNPNEKDRASYLSENFEIYENDSKLCLLDTAYGAREEILPGIFARISNGHTLGLQMIEVADTDHSLVYCADAVPTATHVRVPYIMGYDCYPLLMMEEKKKFLREAEEQQMILFFEHCPRAEAASVLHDGKDFAVKQAYRFS